MRGCLEASSASAAASLNAAASSHPPLFQKLCRRSCRQPRPPGRYALQIFQPNYLVCHRPAVFCCLPPGNGVVSHVGHAWAEPPPAGISRALVRTCALTN